MREPGADTAVAVLRKHARLGAIGTSQLGVRHQLLAVEDADRAAGEVVARPGPVADDVRLVDVHMAQVGALLRCRHLEDRVRVALAKRSGRETRGQLCCEGALSFERI